MTNGQHEDRDNLRLQYQTAQESAHHHDAQIWIVTSIVWAANVVLVGFLAEKDSTLSWLVLVGLGILGSILSAFVWKVAMTYNWVMRRKYQICQHIEKKLELFEDHLFMHENYPRHLQRIWCGVVSVAFLAIWAYVLHKGLHRLGWPQAWSAILAVFFNLLIATVALCSKRLPELSKFPPKKAKDSSPRAKGQ